MTNDSTAPDPHGGLVRRLRFTPLRDLVRGRVTGSLDRAAMIARSGLPEPLERLVASIARRTWLGRRERAEAARELVDRCRQALDEGRTVEQVAESLGPPAAAARDLRRRLIARRSWIGRNVPVAVRLATIAIVAFVGTYLAIAVLDWRQGPNVTTDFVANLNARIDASTPEERGWPRLREGLTAWRGLIEPESTFDAGITDPIARSRMLSRLSTQAQGILPSWTGMARTTAGRRFRDDPG